MTNAPDGKRDFFVSFNRTDRAWATWIAWVLEEAGHSVFFQDWDFRGNFVLDMNEALKRSSRMIAVLSPDFLKSNFTAPEWAASFAQDPRSGQGLLVPVRVRECQVEGLLAQIAYVDLVGAAEQAAVESLLQRVRGDRGKPTTRPGFPGGPPREVTERPSFPPVERHHPAGRRQRKGAPGGLPRASPAADKAGGGSTVVAARHGSIAVPIDQASPPIVPRRPLATNEMIVTSGLATFVPGRKYYEQFRDNANLITDYIERARRKLIMVSINLMTGIPHHGIWHSLEKKFQEDQEFEATISLLDPRNQHLMHAIAHVFGRSAENLGKDITGTLGHILNFRGSLSVGAQRRLNVKVHKALPFGSAILIDYDDPTRARVQIETKPYKEPLHASFAFEIVPTGQEGRDMAKKLSAGLLPFRIKNAVLEIFLVHPGGPFWAKKTKVLGR